MNQLAPDADTIPLDQIDVSDPQLYLDDTWRPLFARLRREDPVHFCAQSRFGPYWSVTRYADITKVELDHAVYSSSAEIGGIQIMENRLGSNLRSFIRMDPPQHTEQRKAVAPIMAPGNLANMEAQIREDTSRVIDALPRNQTFDWADLLATELTATMLATLFDLPREDRRKLTRWADVAVANLGAPDAPIKSNRERGAELMQAGEYFVRLWNERVRQPPKFDLISMLAHGPAARSTTAQELVGNVLLLLVGGIDTTRSSMTGGLLALHENPGQLRKLRADHGLVPGLVSEIIRWQTPAIHMRRTAREDAILEGKRIRKGDKVVMWYVSGNRDESAIENADSFVIDRQRPRQHLSFGAGIHRCVGDRLADLQLRILWQEILARDLEIQVVGPPKRIYSNFLRGYRSLPVKIKG